MTTPSGAAPTAGVSALEELKRLSGLITQTLDEESRAIHAFVAQEDTRTIFSHVRPDGSTPAKTGTADAADVTNGATSTAFAFSRLLPPTPSERPHAALGVTPDELDQLAHTFIADLTLVYTGNNDENRAKETARLPNPYNTSLHLSGLAALGIHGNVTDEAWVIGARMALEDVTSWFEHGARIRRADQTPSDPTDSLSPGELAIATVYGDTNRYLTYLATDALASWLHAWETARPDSLTGIDETDNKQLPNAILDSLRVAYAHGIADLSRQIAAQTIGRQSLFDAMDLICTLATVCIAGNATRLVDEYHRGIVARAITVAGTRHVHDDGSFFPKGAAFTTLDAHSVVLSSAEIGDILFRGVQARVRDIEGTWRDPATSPFQAADLMAFEPAIDAVVRRRSGQRGWGVTSPVKTARPIFTSASSLSLLRRFRDAGSQSLAAHAAQELHVIRYAPNERLKNIVIPSVVWDDITRYTIAPLLEERWERADLSMVLWGPPGTAKSTIAKKIAQELRWPYLELDQGRFLTQGTANLEAEAERIFSLLQDLERTVVLLDEVEGMMGNRAKGSEASSFLTTSMLPRMHHLRDRAKVVFIVATNYKQKLDAAATRPGRIDRMIEVKPPDNDTRATMINDLIATYDVRTRPGVLAETVKSLNVHENTKDWAWGYLEGLIRRCANNIELSDPGEHQKLCAEALKIEQRRYEDEQELYDTHESNPQEGSSHGVNTSASNGTGNLS